MTDVVVVGGGAMGSAAAWQLARRGADVVLLEQFSPGHDRGSSHGSARIVRLSYADPFYVELAAASYPLWDELEAQSGEELVTWTGVVDHGDPSTVDAMGEILSARRHLTERLPPAEAADRWPGLRFDEPVLFHPHGGRAHADRTVAALQRVAERHGAEIRHNARVEAVVPGSEGVDVRTSSAVLRADAVVVAAGAWTASLLDDTLKLPALTVTREQPAHFPPRHPEMPWPGFIHHQLATPTRGTATPRGAYGLSSPDGVKVGFHAVGPVVDPDQAATAVDQFRLRALQDYVESWIPGVDAERPVSTPCLYTLTADSDFVVDRVGSVTVAAGFSGHGFKFAPQIGHIVADLVQGTGPAPGRFRLNRP